MVVNLHVNSKQGFIPSVKLRVPDAQNIVEFLLFVAPLCQNKGQIDAEMNSNKCLL